MQSDWHRARSRASRRSWAISPLSATRQSLAENAVSRFKVLVGVKLVSRDPEGHQVEVLVKTQGSTG